MGHLVAKLNFKFTARQGTFGPRIRYEKLAPFFLDSVDRAAWGKRRCGEDELKFLELTQLGLKSFKRIDRKTSRCDAKLGCLHKLAFEVVPQQGRRVVNDPHASLLREQISVFLQPIDNLGMCNEFTP
ncbi:hypothetical protein [Roseovarius sp. D0-M9]|uniref:hypothetical protein n=1 Tax=Roseovarius sp. D0-M9 TaxID=3127117 RepID=UPI003010243E